MPVFIPYNDFKEKYTKFIPLDKEILEISEYSDISAISEVYFQFIRKRKYKDPSIILCTKEGKAAIIYIHKKNQKNKVEFVDSDLQTRILREIALGNLPKFKRLKIFVKEYGKDYVNLGERNYLGTIRLKLMAGTPGKKLSAGNSKLIVPACKLCDGLVFNRSGEIKPDLQNCIFCGKPLDYYWRVRYIYELDFDFNPEDWHNKNNYGLTMPIRYNGVLLGITVDYNQLYNFLLHYSNLFPNKVVGPFVIALNNIYQTIGEHSCYFYHVDDAIKEIAIMDHDLPDIANKELFHRNLVYPKSAFFNPDIPISQKINKARRDVEKILQNKKEKIKKKKAIENTSVNFNLLLANDDIFDIRKKLSDVYLNITHSKRKNHRDYEMGSYHYSAKYFVKMCTSGGRSKDFDLRLKAGGIKEITEICFSEKGLKYIMSKIQ